MPVFVCSVERCGVERCQDSFRGLFSPGHCHGATSGLSLTSESSGVRRLHIGCCQRRPSGVRRSSEARQASGTFLGRESRGAADAATRGDGRVPLQGTCAWSVVRAGGMSVCDSTFPPASYRWAVRQRAVGPRRRRTNVKMCPGRMGKRQGVRTLCESSTARSTKPTRRAWRSACWQTSSKCSSS